MDRSQKTQGKRTAIVGTYYRARTCMSIRVETARVRNAGQSIATSIKQRNEQNEQTRRIKKGDCCCGAGHHGVETTLCGSVLGT